MFKKLMAIGIASVMVGAIAPPSHAATVDTQNLTYEQLLKRTLGGGGINGGLMDLLGIGGSSGDGLMSMLKGGIFFENEGATNSVVQNKAVKSIAKLVGVKIPDLGVSGPVLGDDNISKIVLAASTAAQGGDVQKSASTILSVLNNAQQTQLKEAAEKTSTDGAVPMAAALEGANQTIVSATDFVDSINLNSASSLDAMIAANQMKQQEIRLKAADTGVNAAATAQAKETNQRLALNNAYQDEQVKRQHYEDRKIDASRSIYTENTLRSDAASRALTSGGYSADKYKYFNF